MRREDKAALERYLSHLDFIQESGHVNPNETDKEKKARIERAKKDYKFCFEYYFPHYATSGTPEFHVRLAKKVKKDKKYKGLVRWGRGLGKSVEANVGIPFWLWINNDIHYMLVVGNNMDKAKILLSDLQAEFESNPQIIADFGEQEKAGSWEDGYFITKNGFIAKALGMGQSPRGLRMRSQRPDYITADDLDDKDLVKNPKRVDEMAKWITNDLIPTMDDGNRRFLMPNNYFAPKTIQETLRLEHPSWDLDQVDAYDSITKLPTWKEKYSSTHFQEVEEEIGTLSALSEYNNKPHVEGKIFKQDQINWIDHKLFPNLNHMKAIAGHWDIAYAGTPTSDFNAVRVWGVKDKNFYHVGSFVAQTKMKEALRWMSYFEKHLPPSVTVHWRFESQFWNDEVKRCIDEVQEETGVNLKLVKVTTPKSNKYDRILKLQPYYQNGRIYFHVKDKGNNHVVVGNNQLFGIEPGYKTKDDAPDADEQAISYLEAFVPKKNDGMPLVGERDEPEGAW